MRLDLAEQTSNAYCNWDAKTSVLLSSQAKNECSCDKHKQYIQIYPLIQNTPAITNFQNF